MLLFFTGSAAIYCNEMLQFFDWNDAIFWFKCYYFLGWNLVTFMMKYSCFYVQIVGVSGDGDGDGWVSAVQQIFSLEQQTGWVVLVYSTQLWSCWRDSLFFPRGFCAISNNGHGPNRCPSSQRVGDNFRAMGRTEYTYLFPSRIPGRITFARPATHWPSAHPKAQKNDEDSGLPGARPLKIRTPQVTCFFFSFGFFRTQSVYVAYISTRPLDYGVVFVNLRVFSHFIIPALFFLQIKYMICQKKPTLYCTDTTYQRFPFSAPNRSSSRL